MKRLSVAVAIGLLLSTPAFADNYSGGGGGGGGGSVTFNTTCPTSTQTGSTINYTNGVNAVAKSISYPLVSGDCGTTFDVSGTGVIMTMPTLAAGYVVAFKNTNASGGANVTISAGTGQTIDGASSFTLAPLQYVQISASTTGTNYDTGTGAAGISVPCNMGYVSGKWSSGCGSTGTSGAVTGGGGNVTCSAFIVSYPGATFKAIGGEVTTTDTTSTGFVWLGLYTNVGGVPGTKIDDIGTTAITAPASANTGISAAFANVTDAIAPGQYWACQATPSTTLVMWGISLNSAYLMPATTVNAAIGGNSAGVAGLQCVAGSSGCGPAWASGATYSGPANFTSPVPTWNQRSSSGAPNLALQVN